MKKVYIENMCNVIRISGRKQFELFHMQSTHRISCFERHKHMGTFKQVKPWVSKKDESYGYKTEMSVATSRAEILVTPNRPGKNDGIEITMEFLELLLYKTKSSSDQSGKTNQNQVERTAEENHI